MKKLLLVGGVASALVLSACGGGSAAARKASIDAYVASLGATPDLQVTLSAGYTGAGSAKAAAVLKEPTFDMDLSNPTGAALSHAKGSINEELSANVGGEALAEIRIVDSNIYFKVNFDAITKIPSAKISSAEVQEVQLLFGNRWFELTKSFVKSEVPSKDATATNAVENEATEEKVVDAIVNIIDTTKVTASGSTYSESGTLYSFVKALYPSIKAVAPKTAHLTMPTASAVKGTYTLSLTASGSVALATSISITAPNDGGNATATLTASFAHASDAVTAPTGATVITPALIHDFESGAGF